MESKGDLDRAVDSIADRLVGRRVYFVDADGIARLLLRGASIRDNGIALEILPRAVPSVDRPIERIVVSLISRRKGASIIGPNPPGDSRDGTILPWERKICSPRACFVTFSGGAGCT